MTAMPLIPLEMNEWARLGLTSDQMDQIAPQQVDPGQNLGTLRTVWEDIQDPAADEVVPLLSRPQTNFPPGGVAGAGDRLTRGYSRAAASKRASTSPNWSGGVIFPSHGQRFYRVAAKWTVSDVGPAALHDHTLHDRPGFHGHHDNDHPIPASCSIWIGLDGYRRWADSMPQLGTEHSADGSHRFWFQWWNPDSTVFHYYLSSHDGAEGPIDLQQGDTVACHMQVLNVAGPGDAVRFDFLRERNGAKTRAAIIMNARPGRPVLGGTAQAVLERPAAPYIDVYGKPKSSGLHPMPNFGSFQFDGFAAAARNANGEREYTAERMKRIANFSRRRGPTRNAIVSRAKLVGNNPDERWLSLQYHP